jgi:hypothetical protein
MESFGDVWGRAIRYGGEPDDPEATIGHESSTTRTEMIRLWKGAGEGLYQLAQVENRISRLMNGNAVGETTTLEELQAQVETQFGGMKLLEQELRGLFAGPSGA